MYQNEKKRKAKDTFLSKVVLDNQLFFFYIC